MHVRLRIMRELKEHDSALHSANVLCTVSEYMSYRHRYATATQALLCLIGEGSVSVSANGLIGLTKRGERKYREEWEKWLKLSDSSSDT